MELAQRLVSTRRGSTMVAILAAVLAGTLILVYIARYRNSIKAEAAPVTVLVARSTIPRGTPGSAVAAKTLYSSQTIRESQLQQGAISDPSSLAGRAASHTIYSGQQLTAADFAGSATSLASSLTDRQRVVTIPFDPARGLTGQLQSGDFVDVFAGFNVVPVNSSGVPLAGGQARPMTRLVMQGIEVVSVGGARGGIGAGAGGSSVTLKVSDVQAAELAFAADNGKLWLALRPPSGAKPSRPEAVTAETMLLGINPIAVVKSLGGH